MLRSFATTFAALGLASCAAPAAGAGSADAAEPLDASIAPDAGSVQDAGPHAMYEACSYIGGLDRIGIWRKDEATGECAYLRLVSPGGTSDYLAGLELPENWGVENARLGHPDSCDCQALGGFEGAQAIDGSGVVTFDVPDGGYWPQTISVDVALTFDGGSVVRFETSERPLMP